MLIAVGADVEIGFLDLCDIGVSQLTRRRQELMSFFWGGVLCER